MAKTIEQLEREIKELRLVLKNHFAVATKAAKEQTRIFRKLTKQVDALVKQNAEATVISD